MHLQSVAYSSSLVLADVAEAVAVQAFREVQIRSVLNCQDSLIFFHATDRPFAVTVQDTVWIDLLCITVDEPIVGFQFMSISRKALCIRSRGLLSLGGGDTHQSLLAILMTQVYVAEPRFDPVAVVKRLFQVHRLDFFAKGWKT